MTKDEFNVFFHRIANGQEECFTIKETELFRVILDIDPISKGHMLIIPKRNIIELEQLSETEIIGLHILIKEMSELIRSKYPVNGISIMQNGGSNNDINYLHVHIIPRYHNDGFSWESEPIKVNLKQVHKNLVSK